MQIGHEFLDIQYFDLSRFSTYLLDLLIIRGRVCVQGGSGGGGGLIRTRFRFRA